MDFFETLNPVVWFDTMRIALVVSALKGRDVKALDFKKAHLNAPHSEETWLELATGEVVQACKAVHALRPSAMKWWRELQNSIVGTGL